MLHYRHILRKKPSVANTKFQTNVTKSNSATFVNTSSRRAFGNAVRNTYPSWDTGVQLEPTRFQFVHTFALNDSEMYAPSSTVTMYRNEYHQLGKNTDLQSAVDGPGVGRDLDPFTAEKRPEVHHVLDLDWSFAGDPHMFVGFARSEFSMHAWVREPTFPKTPDLSRGQLAAGATVTRTEVWKNRDEPAVVSVARFSPDNFRAFDYENNAPIPATTAPDQHMDFRSNRLPLGHADRRAFCYFSTMVSLGIGCALLRTCFVKAAYTLWPDRGLFAAGTIEVDLKQIRVGQNLLVKWRGKPVFIKRRTNEEIEQAKSDDSLVGSMRDPEVDAERAIKSDYLVVIGVCTHLGCIPYADQGDFHGYYCPCHGSHYDTSGRIRRGPAPKNLDVPPHSYVDNYTIKIG